MRMHLSLVRALSIGSFLGIAVALLWMRVEASTSSVPSPESDVVVAPEPLALSGLGGGDDELLVEPVPLPAARPVVITNTPPAPPDARVVRLRVPFVSQAPFRIWNLPYKEFCEEASLLTLHLWKQGKPTPPADALDRALKELQAWETEQLGTWEDTTAVQGVRLLREYFGYADARVVESVSIDRIKRELDAGRPVVVPAAGRALPNPYFQRPGPLYHMLVIIGYDDRAGEFITNDVGTNTKGAGLRYRYDDLYRAMGDWSEDRHAPDTTRKVMIVLS
ncbi:C39 family peptidase [Candidatus Uhrbacteria bacterium]|nr:C39 family peptidase [Candidatus Uhrbacteria bacterium]